MRLLFVVWLVLNSAYALFLVGPGEVRDSVSVTCFALAIIGELILAIFGLEASRSPARLVRFLLFSLALGVYTVLSAMPEDREIAQLIVFFPAAWVYTNIIVAVVEWLFGQEEEMSM